jgi:peptide methionine sulfoxide reductase MsrA
MTIAKLINHLNTIENKDKEIQFTDIATNYKYKIFTINKDNGEIIIEDTEE